MNDELLKRVEILEKRVQELEDKQPKSRMQRPSAVDIQNYLFSKGYGTHEQRVKLSVDFINFYTSKGWKIGKNPMVNWKSAVNTWTSKNRDNGNNDSGNLGKKPIPTAPDGQGSFGRI